MIRDTLHTALLTVVVHGVVALIAVVALALLRLVVPFPLSELFYYANTVALTITCLFIFAIEGDVSNEIGYHPSDLLFLLLWLAGEFLLYFTIAFTYTGVTSL